MGKATQRRERRLVRDLQELYQRDRAGFDRMWNNLMSAWAHDIMARGRRLRADFASQADTGVFSVLDKAERLIAAVGPEAEARVGHATRELLSHECCKAVAAAGDPNLYTLTCDSVYRTAAAFGREPGLVSRQAYAARKCG